VKNICIETREVEIDFTLVFKKVGLALVAAELIEKSSVGN
jgi:hypothetical protein